MNSSIAGVRQNLKLLVDHGKVSPNLNADVETNWGATLGGGYYVWRSGLGITKDGRIVYVYGSGAQRAGPRPSCCSGPARWRACRWTSTRPG